MHLVRAEVAELNIPWWKVSDDDSKKRVLIKKTLEHYGQLKPIVGAFITDDNPAKLSVIDGRKIVSVAQEIGIKNLDAIVIENVSTPRAIELAIIIKGCRDEADRIHLAECLDFLCITNSTKPDEMARLAEVLPFRSKDFGKVIKRLRRQKPAHTIHRASKVSFNFRVEPSAAPVISQAIDRVVATQDVTRDRALELICADFNAGQTP